MWYVCKYYISSTILCITWNNLTDMCWYIHTLCMHVCTMYNMLCIITNTCKFLFVGISCMNIIFMYVHIEVFIQTWLRTDICTYVCIYVCKYMCKFILSEVHMYIHTYLVCAHLYMYMYLHNIHRYQIVYIDAYKHTYILVLVCTYNIYTFRL